MPPADNKVRFGKSDSTPENVSIQQLLSDTGQCMPLAAQMMKAIRDSGADDLEITVALTIVEQLRYLLAGKGDSQRPNSGDKSQAKRTP